MFLGILFDSESLTLSLDQERIEEILDLLKQWLTRKSTKRKELESLIAKLSFAANCVRPGRVFIARLLNFLRGLPRNAEVPIEPDIKNDMEWWLRFLSQFNGVSMMAIADWFEPDEVVATDACLVGCGGIAGREYFHSPFSGFIQTQSLSINCLELLTIMVALKLWSHTFKGQRILIYCDNQASVHLLNAGSSKIVFSQACLREITFLAATLQFEIKAIHLPGVQNRVPDLLSRWELDQGCRQEFLSLTDGTHEQCFVDESLFRFSQFW